MAYHRLLKEICQSRRTYNEHVANPPPGCTRWTVPPIIEQVGHFHIPPSPPSRSPAQLPTLGTSPGAGQFAFDVMAGPGPSFSLIISFIQAVIIFIIPHPFSPRSQTFVQLKASAKAKGLWNLFLPPGEHPGVEGLFNAEYAHLAEVMGRCRIASEACNCSAPDTGNMEVILSSTTPAARRCANDVFALLLEILTSADALQRMYASCTGLEILT